MDVISKTYFGVCLVTGVKLMLSGPIKAKPLELKSISPSSYEIIESCKLRAIFAHDPTTSGLIPPTPGLVLGNVCHSIYEDFNRGRFTEYRGRAIPEVLRPIWDERIAKAFQDLKTAWGERVEVPKPARWPRYQQIKIHFLKHIEREHEKWGSNVFVPTAQVLHSENEQWLESSDGKIIGRPDRVEIHGAQVELIDLKTGAIDNYGAEPIGGKYRRQLLLYAYLWWDTHNVWPSRASVESIDGNRYSFEVDAEECKTVASNALRALTSFNESVNSSVNVNSLANPTPETCVYCPYKGGCMSFWKAVCPEWGWYSIFILGIVSNVEKSRGAVTVSMHPENTNLLGSNDLVRVLNSPDYEFERGLHLGIVGAQPTNSQTNLRSAWDTLYWQWPS